MVETEYLNIPQADNFSRVLDIPLAIEEGNRNVREIARRNRFQPRQARYYLQAAEFLGLVVKREDRYSLSRIGRTYVALTEPQRNEMIVRKMLALPIILAVIQELFVSPLHRLGRSEVEKLVKSKTRVRGATVHRRVQSLFSWISWLGDETGVLKVSKDAVSIRS